MPRGGPYLSDAEITLIKNWIDQGATVTSTTGILQMTPDVPVEFSLSQNYPNPFNPSTRIAFTIPAEKFVKLTIFDITGREVAALVNGTVKPGSYSIEWNGSNAASGIYFYRLSAGDQSADGGQSFTLTKKFILQK